MGAMKGLFAKVYRTPQGRRLGRSPQPPRRALLDEVLDEYVSVEAARRDYGVVLTGDLWALTLAIDHDATARLRADMRARR
jgi:N-methylhydantoinase B